VISINNYKEFNIYKEKLSKLFKRTNDIMAKIVLEKEGTRGYIEYDTIENEMGEFEIYKVFYSNEITIEIRHKIK